MTDSITVINDTINLNIRRLSKSTSRSSSGYSQSDKFFLHIIKTPIIKIL
ncbi:MAG: hypothetical protein ACI4PS_01535 [Rhodocyclaceae bacterium]